MASSLAAADPWASNDHDPTGHPQAPVFHPVTLRISHTLAMARDDIHHAIAADDDHCRRQYALSARDNAGHVLSDPDCTPAERQCAGYYFADAEAIVAHTGGDPDA
jgi:hypothetical protein